MDIKEINRNFNKKMVILGLTSLSSLALSIIFGRIFNASSAGAIFIAITIISTTLIPWLIVFTSLKNKVAIFSVGRKVYFVKRGKKRNILNYLFFFYLILSFFLSAATLLFIKSFISSTSDNVLAKYCDSSWSKFSKDIPSERRFSTEECFVVYNSRIAVIINNEEVFSTNRKEHVKRSKNLIHDARQIFTTEDANENLSSWDQLPVSGGIPQALYIYDESGEEIVIKTGEIPERYDFDASKIFKQIRETINNL